MRLGPQHGLTLIELLVTFAIIAVLAVIGMPMFLSALQASEVQAAAEEMVAALNGARQLAVSRNGSVCVTLDGSTLQYRAATCAADPPLREVRLTSDMTVAGGPVTFTYLGAATPAATYTVTKHGRTLSVLVSASGGARIGAGP